MWGTAAWTAKNVPFRLTPTTRSKVRSSTASKSPPCQTWKRVIQRRFNVGLRARVRKKSIHFEVGKFAPFSCPVPDARVRHEDVDAAVGLGHGADGLAQGAHVAHVAGEVRHAGRGGRRRRDVDAVDDGAGRRERRAARGADARGPARDDAHVAVVARRPELGGVEEGLRPDVGPRRRAAGGDGAEARGGGGGGGGAARGWMLCDARRQRARAAQVPRCKERAMHVAGAMQRARRRRRWLGRRRSCGLAKPGAIARGELNGKPQRCSPAAWRGAAARREPCGRRERRRSQAWKEETTARRF